MNSRVLFRHCYFTTLVLNSIGTLKAQDVVHSNALGILLAEKVKGVSSTCKQPIQVLKKVNFDNENLQMQSAFLIEAVTSFKPVDVHSLPCQESNSQVTEFSYAVTTGVVEAEKVRRKKISNANKGKIPWNKGRKHSAETIRRIQEKTKLAMQNPKVKLKLANIGHAQSKNTRAKIGAGVRMGWQRRNEKLALQQTCCLEWQNLIAEACRRGYMGEIELQWSSYKIMKADMERELSESVKDIKSTSKTIFNRRAPKSLEQRKKISEAISAKWADPVYRDRVQSAQLKYYGTPIGAYKNTTSSGFTKETISQRWFRLRKSSEASFKDPFADSKMQMLKTIRSQRSAIETDRTKAVQRAKLMISEAEKAVKALELVPKKSPLVQVSLLECKKFLAKANGSMEKMGKNW